MFLANRGSWSELVTVPTHRVAPIPDDVSFAQAATLPVAGLTALRAIRSGGPVLGGESWSPDRRGSGVRHQRREDRGRRRTVRSVHRCIPEEDGLEVGRRRAVRCLVPRRQRRTKRSSPSAATTYSTPSPGEPGEKLVAGLPCEVGDGVVRGTVAVRGAALWRGYQRLSGWVSWSKMRLTRAMAIGWSSPASRVGSRSPARMRRMTAASGIQSG